MIGVPTPYDGPRPAPARVFDALTGGWHNLPEDHAVAERLLAADPSMRWWAIVHQHVRTRAIEALAAAGITQYLDLGCGMPNPASTYKLLTSDANFVARRLVCVDHDPVVIACHRDPVGADTTGVRVTALHSDLSDPHQLLTDVALSDGIDLGEPVAILLTGVLHHLNDPDAVDLLAVLRDYVVTGSWLVLSHPSRPPAMTAALDAAISHCQTTTGTRWTLRDISYAASLLGTGWTPQPPGITSAGRWHPTIGPDTDPDPDISDALRTAAGWTVLATAAPERRPPAGTPTSPSPSRAARYEPGDPRTVTTSATTPAPFTRRHP